MTEEEEMAADAVMIADLQIIAACGLSYCLSAVADAAMAVADMAMTVACGSSYYSSAVADLEMAVADVVAAVDAAVATTAASSHLSKQLRRLCYKVKMREIRLTLPRSLFLFRINKPVLSYPGILILH